MDNLDLIEEINALRDKVKDQEREIDRLKEKLLDLEVSTKQLYSAVSVNYPVTY